MKRENEFKAFLNKNKLPTKYSSYCKKIEEAFGGIDMDEIILSHQSISKVHDKLKTITKNDSSISQYMSALNHYLKFAFSFTKPIAIFPSAHHSSSQYHVSRAEDVPLTTEIEIICQTLEQEYANIIRFAEILLVQEGFKYIPIIISNEAPMRDSPQGGENVLGRFFSSSKPYIEIYYHNLDSHNIAEIRQCLAHEYLHYLHYSYAEDKYTEANKELKEALADFLGVLYSVHRKGKDDLKVAKKRYDQWKKNCETYWSYANALYFYQVGSNEMKYSSDYNEYVRHGCIGKFVQVFSSTQHPDNAYIAMLNC